MNDYISPAPDEPSLIRRIVASHPAYAKDADTEPDLSQFTVYRELIDGSIRPDTVIEKWEVSDKRHKENLVISRAVKRPMHPHTSRTNMLGVRPRSNSWQYEARTLLMASELGIPGIPRAYSFAETHDALIMEYLPEGAARLHVLLRQSESQEQDALDAALDDGQRARLAQQYAAKRRKWALASLERLVFLQNGLAFAKTYRGYIANPHAIPDALRLYNPFPTKTNFAAALCARVALSDDAMRPQLQAVAARQVPGTMSRFYYAHLSDPYRRIKHLFAPLESRIREPKDRYLRPTAIHGDYYPSNILLDADRPDDSFIVDLDKVAFEAPGILDFVKFQGGVYEAVPDEELRQRYFAYIGGHWRFKQALHQHRRALTKAPTREQALDVWDKALAMYRETPPPAISEEARIRQLRALDCALVFETAYLMGVRVMYPLRFPEHAKNIWASPETLALWRFYTPAHPVEADLVRLDRLLTSMAENTRGYPVGGGLRHQARALRGYLDEVGVFGPVPAHCYGPQPD